MWMYGQTLSGSTVGIVGLGRIGEDFGLAIIILVLW